MIPRFFLLIAVCAAAWMLWAPATVDLDEISDPDRYADAMGIPEVFDPPARDPKLGLDPTPYRGRIVRIETILYRRGGPRYGDGGAVGHELVRMGDELMSTRDGFRAHDGGQQLIFLSGRFGQYEDAGYTLPSLVRMRGEWEAARERIFEPAEWMAKSTPDLDKIQEPPVHPEAFPATDAPVVR